MNPQVAVALLVLGVAVAGCIGWRTRGGVAVGAGIVLFGGMAAWAWSDGGTCAMTCSNTVTFGVVVAVSGVAMMAASVVSATRQRF